MGGGSECLPGGQTRRLSRAVDHCGARMVGLVARPRDFSAVAIVVDIVVAVVVVVPEDGLGRPMRNINVACAPLDTSHRGDILWYRSGLKPIAGLGHWQLTLHKTRRRRRVIKGNDPLNVVVLFLHRSLWTRSLSPAVVIDRPFERRIIWAVQVRHFDDLCIVVQKSFLSRRCF